MDEWDWEVFSEQLKKSGNHPDSEYIDVDEDPDTQIDREMERLAIAESQLADTPCFAGLILILFLVTFHLITSHQMLVFFLTQVSILSRLIAMQTSMLMTASHPLISLPIQFWKLPSRYVFVHQLLLILSNHHTACCEYYPTPICPGQQCRLSPSFEGR